MCLKARSSIEAIDFLPFLCFYMSQGERTGISCSKKRQNGLCLDGHARDDGPCLGHGTPNKLWRDVMDALDVKVRSRLSHFNF